MSNNLLKSIIQDLIADRTDEAEAGLKSYLIQKTQSLTGLVGSINEDTARRGNMNEAKKPPVEDLIPIAIQALEKYSNDFEFEVIGKKAESYFSYMNVEGLVILSMKGDKLQVLFKRPRQRGDYETLDSRKDERFYTADEINDPDFAGRVLERAENTMYA